MAENWIWTPKPGDPVEPDEWRSRRFEKLQADDGFKDNSFPGCQFRLPSTGGDLAVNIKVTGKPHLLHWGWYRSRCRIEFVGDGELSTFSGGWIYHPDCYCTGTEICGLCERKLKATE